MERQVKAGKPFFCRMNTTRMHFRTHVRAEHRDKPGFTARTEYADRMIEHDGTVGALLRSSTISASPTTRSSSTRRTTART
jgi:arylsulfatase